MKRLLLSVLTVAALTTGSAYSASPLSGSAACRGEIFNPINDANWNNMFPVTVAGISMGGGSNPSLMHMDSICLCPGPYGIDMPGIGMTFWEPTFLAESGANTWLYVDARWHAGTNRIRLPDF